MHRSVPRIPCHSALRLGVGAGVEARVRERVSAKVSQPTLSFDPKGGYLRRVRLSSTRLTKGSTTSTFLRRRCSVRHMSSSATSDLPPEVGALYTWLGLGVGLGLGLGLG